MINILQLEAQKMLIIEWGGRKGFLGHFGWKEIKNRDVINRIKQSK